jgi:hypothetical protein
MNLAHRVFLSIFLLCCVVAYKVNDATPVSADNYYSTVDVTFTPQLSVLPVVGFTATYINDTKVRLDWTNPDPANLTVLIVGKQGDTLPMNQYDGYVVYNGTGSTANDTAVNFNALLGDANYLAFTVDNGTYSSPVTGQVENITMLLSTFLIGFLIGAVVLTSVSLVKKEPFSALISVLLWALTAGAAYISHKTVWDIYYLAFWGFMFLALAMGIYSAVEFAADADKGGDVFEEGGGKRRHKPATSPATVNIFKNDQVDFSTDYQSMLGEVSSMRGELRGGVKRSTGWSAPAAKSKKAKVVKFW